MFENVRENVLKLGKVDYQGYLELIQSVIDATIASALAERGGEQAG